MAASPLAAALLALVAAYTTGFNQRSAMPAEIADRFYGFFLDRYPLFAFVLVYGLARLLAAMLTPGRAGGLRRLVGGAIGIALLLTASLYPTFGGLVLRSGFNVGTIAFFNAMSMPAAYALGSAAAALAFGLPLWLGVTLSGGRGSTRGGGLAARFGTVILDTVARFIALWFGAALIGLAHEAGFGPWPRRPLDVHDLTVAAGLLTGAALPHTLFVGIRFSTLHKTR